MLRDLTNLSCFIQNRIHMLARLIYKSNLIQVLTDYQNGRVKRVTIKSYDREFLAGPVVRTLHFHFRGHRFDPWSGK